MLNMVFDGKNDLNEPTKQFYFKNMMDASGSEYEADDYKDMTAALCGTDFFESQSAETDWHMRRAAANQIGLQLLAAAEVEMELAGELEPDEDGPELLIVYDERIGKIPYSLTDPVVDYGIHGTPELIRIESNKNFIWTLFLLGVLNVHEKNDVGEYVPWRVDSVKAWVKAEAKYFKENGDKTQVPLFKKLGE